MDLATLKAQIEKSREFDTEYGGVKFLLRLPTEQTWRTLTEDHYDDRGRVQQARVARALAEAGLIGWEGLKAEHILKGAGDHEVPYSSEGISLLLDERQDIADHIAKLLTKKYRQRISEQEASRKNSESASSTS
jgi:hypothetical protein